VDASAVTALWGAVGCGYARFSSSLQPRAVIAGISGSPRALAARTRPCPARIMPCFVYEHLDFEAPLANGLRKLRDLLFAVDARVPRIWNEFFNRPLSLCTTGQSSRSCPLACTWPFVLLLRIATDQLLCAKKSFRNFADRREALGHRSRLKGPDFLGPFPFGVSVRRGRI
jgi:hypothetical protein